MASLTKKIIRGRAYYYLRECRRVDGKPKIVFQQYIGSQEELIARLRNPSPHEAFAREFGAVVATYDMAEQLDLVNIVDHHVAKRGRQGPSVGQYLLTATINRCLAPCSKARIAEWYERTVLPRLLRIKASQLTSQRFWDNMDRISEKHILSIERDISERVVSRFDLDLSCLLFDATNFFTFMDTFNGRSRLAKRGHSKEGRDSLRILGLALLVTADGEVPLLHHVYAGNKADSTVFSRLSGELQRRCLQLGKGVCDITLVFDKGNNSHKNLNRIGKAPFHFVGSLVPTHHPRLLAIDRDQMRRLDPARLPAVWAYRIQQPIFGVQRTVLVTYNRRFYRAQARTLLREINKRKRQLHQLKDALVLHNRSPKKGNKPTQLGTQNRIDRILAARHMKDLFFVKLSLTKNKIPKLSWRFNIKQWSDLKKTLLGKTLLFTDRSDWSDEQIVLAYRSQYHVEAAFRSMKNPRYLSFRPINHWTDQKLRVHAFYCVLALLILTLIRRQLDKQGIHMSIPRMIERLSEIREIVTLYKSANEKRQRLVPIISRRDQEQQSIVDALDLPKYFPK